VTMNWRRLLALALFGALAMGQPAAAQTSGDGWRFAVYPVLGWVPLGIEIDVDVPPHDGGDGGAADIIDGRLDGAFLGGFSATNGRLRVEGDIIWAAVGGDRLELPRLTVDADLIYGHAMFGVAVAPEWYASVGLRRLALNYDITVGDQATFERDPGVWDPLLGIGWHRDGDAVDWHVTFEGGGFGVGADVDLGAAFRLDWRPVRHFGITAGYNFFYFKVTDEVRDREFVVKQTLHGPLLGIGFYF
jgi:hypothetical protein